MVQREHLIQIVWYTRDSQSRYGATRWYCEWNYRDASRLCTHGLLSILSWYAEKQFLSSVNWASGERSSDMTTSSSWAADGVCDAQVFNSSSTIWTPFSMTSGENCDSCEGACSERNRWLNPETTPGLLSHLPAPKSSSSSALRLASYDLVR
jgi:hypothetical protein